MAGLKKPSRKRDSSSPNLILVIFLVFFVLVSIGLGVWGYYGYADKEKTLAEAKQAANREKAAKLGEELERMVRLELFDALGRPLDNDQRTDLDGLRGEFWKEGGKFDKEKNREALKTALEETRKSLGFKEKYDKTYPQEVKKLDDDKKAAVAEVAKLQEQLDSTKKKFKDLQDAQDAQHKLTSEDIRKGNDLALKASRTNNGMFAKAVEENKKLSDKLAEISQDAEKIKGQLERRIREQQTEIQKRDQQKTELVSVTRNPTEVHALLLDISSGKPLWDRPLGKIMRVDMAQRQVVVGLGSASGVQPELTFSVFGAGPYGGAEKHLKGTIEITRVVDANTSLARITSLYDEHGQEISLNDRGNLRLQRESEAALREGDLLFNMFWGNHVAIAGPAALVGLLSDSPAEQMRQLADFGYFLERQGMPVDAYVDLADGTIKGQTTAKTRYLIYADLHGEAKEAQAERAKAVADAIAALKKDATEEGMFLISADNFLNIVGFRKPRSQNQQELAGSYRPGQPRAGLALPGLFMPGRAPAAAPEAVGAPPAAAPPAEEKKEEK
jgi:hypothetical protein